MVDTQYARTRCTSALGDSTAPVSLAIPPAALERGEFAGSVRVVCRTSHGRHSCEAGPRAEACESAQPRLEP